LERKEETASYHEATGISGLKISNKRFHRSRLRRPR
jgi:hypothetical protein